MPENKCILLYDDKFGDAIFSGPSWQLPLTNMQDPRPSKVARSADATAEKTQFFMTFSEAVTLPGMFFVNTNLTVNATYRITAYSDGAFSIQTFTTNEQPVWTSSKPFIDPDFKGMPVLALFGADVTSLYWGVEFIDADNPAGYVEVGLGFCGKRCNLTYMFAENSGFGRDSNTSVQRALTKTPYFNRHKNFRSWDLLFPNETYEVSFDEIDTMWEISGVDRPIFFLPFPDDLDRRQRQSFIGNFDKLSRLAMLSSKRASTGFSITEYV